MKSHFSNVLFISFGTLSYFSFGTAMMDYFLLYPSRFLVGEKEFVTYHKFLESAILPISVYPFFLLIFLNLLLFWHKPEGLSNTLIWISFMCLLLDLMSTAFFQAPWNFELSKGKNVLLMQKITDTNWVRVFLESMQVVIAFIMLISRYIVRPPDTSPDALV